PIQPANKSLPRQNGRRRHGNVRFRLGPLLDVDLAPMPEERLLDHARVGKLVRQTAWTSWFLRQQIFDHAGVPPAEQLVQVAKLLVEVVVPRWTDEHCVGKSARDFSN